MLRIPRLAKAEARLAALSVHREGGRPGAHCLLPSGLRLLGFT